LNDGFETRIGSREGEDQQEPEALGRMTCARICQSLRGGQSLCSYYNLSGCLYFIYGDNDRISQVLGVYCKRQQNSNKLYIRAARTSPPQRRISDVIPSAPGDLKIFNDLTTCL